LRIIMPTSVLLLLVLAVAPGVARAFSQSNSVQKAKQPSSSSSARPKSRKRRVVAKSSGQSTSSAAKQPTARKATGTSNVSVQPLTAAKASELPAKAIGPKPTEESAERSSEEPDDTKSLPGTAADPKGDGAPNALVSLRYQIEATPMGPEHIRLQLNLAEQLVAANKKAEATKVLQAITKADVFDPQGFYNAGNALARLGDSDEALNAYRKAIDQRKGKYSRSLNNLGVVLLREGRWDEAYDALLSAMRLESFRYPEASYNLGRLYFARGERDLAIREWHHALAIDPEHSGAAQALASGEAGIVVGTEESAKGPSIDRKAGRVPEDSVKNALRARPTKDRLVTRGHQAAKVRALDALSYNFLQRARNLNEHGKLQEAVENYQQVISRSQGYFPPANLELSCVLMNLKRKDEAFVNLLRVTNRDGARYPSSYYYLARLYEQKGDLIKAEESFVRAAAAYESKNSPVLLDLSRVRERRGNFKGALAVLEEYVVAMEQQGLKPSWADETLSVLRQKATASELQPK
jgi:tetratricopeptide (TPR) repeat protein